MTIYCKPIKGYNSFSTLFKEGMKVKTYNILCSVKFNDNVVEKETHPIYYGVTISKRNAKKAILRNRVKRLLRESFRTLVKEHNNKQLGMIDSIVFAWQIAPKHKNDIALNDVLPAVQKVLAKALAIHTNKKKNYK